MDHEHRTHEAKEYQRLLLAYRDSLAAGGVDTDAVRAQVDAARQRLGPSDPSGPVSAADHVLLLFCFAIDVGAKAEAKRLYAAMSERAKAEIDSSETAEPGFYKIWEEEGTR